LIPFHSDTKVTSGVQGDTSCPISTNTSDIIPSIGACTRSLARLNCASLRAICADLRAFSIVSKFKSLVDVAKS
jgi:hypothetical protein